MMAVHGVRGWIFAIMGFLSGWAVVDIVMDTLVLVGVLPRC
jgi:hypothetical protein